MVYVSKDSFKNISLFYYKRVKEIYEKVYDQISPDNKQFENPKELAHNLKVFDIKTTAQRIDISGYHSVPGGRTRITIKRSLDINLKNYIAIEIEEGR